MKGYLKVNNEEIKLLPNRLQFFPVMMFAMVMGFSGLAIVYKKAHEILGWGELIADILAYLSIVLFATILVTYLLKIFKYTEQFKQELSHPIRINFFAAISISFVLISILTKEINYDISFICFSIGAILHLFFTFNTLSFWINKAVEVQHSNPAWFIPIVGNLIVPVGGVGYFSNSVLMFYFSIGIFFWMIMLSIILNRIIFHKQFAQKFMPTLFILIAPPSIGLVAYIKMTNTLDMFAMILFNLGLFFTFLLLFMYKNFLKIQFFISWWAFTFPLATIALATMLVYSKLQEVIYLYFSYLFIVAVTIVVAIVAVNTVKHMLKREICIME